MISSNTFGLYYKSSDFNKLESNINDDWVESFDDKKETYSYALFFAYNLFSQSNKK